MHNLKDVLLLISRHNIIYEPTSQLALLDLIILHEDMSPLIQGIIRVPPDISDHYATYVYLPFEYPKHAKELFYNNSDSIVSNFHNNDKRKFWKGTRDFVKNNKSTSSIPPLCSSLSNSDSIWHFNNQDKANCLNDYFASISIVNDSETQLPPFTKITDKALSQINCTELEI